MKRVKLTALPYYPFVSIILKLAIMRKLTQEEFIEKARNVHGDDYDYSKSKYNGYGKKLVIICKKCGKEFFQNAGNHLNGKGCPYCHGGVSITKEDFIEKARKVHGDKYDYSKVEYLNNHIKVCIICPVHGEFWQTPNSHLNGAGCPICKASHGEKIIEKYLNEIT